MHQVALTPLTYPIPQLVSTLNFVSQLMTHLFRCNISALSV